MNPKALLTARIEHFLDLGLLPLDALAARLPHPVLVVEIDSEQMQRRHSRGLRRAALDTSGVRALWQHMPALAKNGMRFSGAGTLRYVLGVKKREGAAPSPRFSLGRTRESDIVLPDRRVSKFHAYLERDEHGCFSITDTGSRNRTRLNERELVPYEPERMISGDRLSFGPFASRFFVAADFARYLRLLIESDEEGK